MSGIRWIPTLELRVLEREFVDEKNRTYNREDVVQQKWHGTEHKMVGHEVEVISHEEWRDLPRAREHVFDFASRLAPSPTPQVSPV